MLSNTQNLAAAGSLNAAIPHHEDATILMIDDEKLNSFVVAEYLKMGGYRDLVHTADPLGAISLAHRVRPDVILLDIEMPKLNGLDLLRMIRADRLLAETAVLVLSATVNEATRIKLIDLQAAGILKKPVRKDELLARLQPLVAGAKR
jgi:two-component system cell cycle response regulator DivK